MSSQGIKGPDYKFPYGNTKEIMNMRNQSMNKPMDISHDIFPRIQPHVYSWTKIYGKNYLNWHGSQAQLFITEGELIKEVLTNREGAYPKMDMEGYAKKLLGEALITNEGEKWAKVRKLANHTFHAESLKNMVPGMSASVEVMLDKWRHHGGKEIDVFNEFGLLTTEVISRTAFGSSYKEGKDIFEMVAKLTAITVWNVYKVRFPGISMLLRSSDEIEAEKLEKGIKSSILELVAKREKEKKGENDHFGNDYLGQLMRITHDSNINKRITLEQMIDEIKALYGAGHLTTTNLLAWSVFLLAIHSDWQEKARTEAFEIFGYKNPSSDGIARLKTMNMIINECLRLYPPVLTMTRKVEREVRLGNLNIPTNINIYLPILALHHNPQIWGKDVHLFKPERFAEGVAKATNNNAAAFFPFGLGPRTCVGLNFTTNEAKIALSMILQRYKFLNKVWLKPIYIQYCMRLQGINGPSYKLLHGNTKEIIQMRRYATSRAMEDLSHNIFPRILPDVNSWIRLYGATYLNWYGLQPQLVVTEPELVKEILNNKNDNYPKIDLEGYARKLLGDGLSSSKGEKWANMRNLANKVFHAESLKNVIPEMITSTEIMLERWKENEGKEVEVFDEFRVLTSEVISRTAFGSSYKEGKNIFEMLMKLTLIVSRNAHKIRFPGISRFLKSNDDIESEKLEEGIKSSIKRIIKRREQESGEEESSKGDFLDKLLEANHGTSKSKLISVEDMVDECKTFYFAGHETTTSLLGWTILLLSINKEWQEKAREEVIELVGQNNPIANDIPRLKTMNMILEETLRLYPPVPFIKRKVDKKVKLGRLTLPAHTELLISPLALHHDPKIWGEDIDLFKPERFAVGVSQATNNNPVAFMPFGFGPRTCVGLNFAITEAKVALSMILQRYKFTLSSNYVHSPIQVFMVRPQHGVKIILSKV
ncbi:hypothetical protein ACH5RR_035982 [Cinchona calisaya]|uniref:Cytochrome P450 n=1 Tax=Cinchona calisaya TaxID=153742 RepID=A0ABD2Y339_9GENT